MVVELRTYQAIADLQDYSKPSQKLRIISLEIIGVDMIAYLSAIPPHLRKLISKAYDEGTIPKPIFYRSITLDGEIYPLTNASWYEVPKSLSKSELACLDKYQLIPIISIIELTSVLTVMKRTKTSEDIYLSVIAKRLSKVYESVAHNRSSYRS